MPRTFASRLTKTVIGGACVLAVILGPARSTQADDFNPVFQYYVTYSMTATGSSPDINVQMNIDCPAGVCPASSNAPLLDVATMHYSAALHSCKTSDATPGCSGATPPVDAVVGSLSFQVNTNVSNADLPDNVNAATGVPLACGAPGTTPRTSSLAILNGAINPSDRVSGKDGVDADTLPDSQADVRGLTPVSPPNGAPDGADALPDYVPLVLSNALSLVTSRGYGVMAVVPGVEQVDVNLLTLDLTSFGAGYATIVMVGDQRPFTVADLNAGQSTEICAPFTMTLSTLGVSSDNPSTSATEAAQPVRALAGGGATPLHFAVMASSDEDVDGDGIPPTVDRCDNPDVGSFPAGNGLTSLSGAGDSDGDGLGDACDPDPGTADNCPGVASSVKSAACNAASANPPLYPTRQSGCGYGPNKNITIATCTTPWDPDQDIDGDGHANWSDDCPVLANPAQIDRNRDRIGDDCQAKRFVAATGSAIGISEVFPAGRPERPERDYDDFCDAATTIGGPTLPSTTCYAPTAHDLAGGILTGVPSAGIAQDSDDDGFPDLLTVPGFTLTDKNSDADWDGCSDYSETSGGSATGVCGPAKGVAPGPWPGTQCGIGIPVCENAKKANTNGDGSCISSTLLFPNNYGFLVPSGVNTVARCVDGGKDANGGGIVDWLDLALDPAQTDNTASPLTGTTDSDEDGCSNRREALPAAPISGGGGRSGLNRWDFFDTDQAVDGGLQRNRAINVNDAIAILTYIGGSAGAPYTPNSHGKAWAGDDNLDGIRNYERFDRSPGTAGLTSEPSNAINIGDPITVLVQIGADCSTP